MAISLGVVEREFIGREGLCEELSDKIQRIFNGTHLFYERLFKELTKEEFERYIFEGVFEGNPIAPLLKWEETLLKEEMVKAGIEVKDSPYLEIGILKINNQ